MRDVPQIMMTIMKVRSGLMTAVHAAEELGISRKTYYKLENEALEGMCLSLQPGSPGRPPNQLDQEKEALKSQVKELQTQLILSEQDIAILKILFGEIPDAVSSKKKPRRKKR